MWLGNKDKVYILDKTENNPVTINGKFGTHPAWAVEYDIKSNTCEYITCRWRTKLMIDRPMDVLSNTFCACGAQLGNGTWAIFGGNQRESLLHSTVLLELGWPTAVTTGGVATTTPDNYMNTAGGTAIRMLDACTDESCEYVQGEQPFNQNEGDTGGWLQMTGRRWYPTSETLEDGSIIVIGGDKNGGYVNTAAQDNPTYEFFPPKGDGEAVDFPFLSETLPINLYALTWMMPSGKLFIQSNRRSILFDYKTKDQEELPEMPYAARVYPASAATMMLPLLPENNYTATILFCGGSNPPQWGNDGTAGYNVTAVPADNTCVRISPDDANPTYDDDDYMLEGRSMGQFVLMPDGTAWMGNGVAMGTAGYGNELYSIGQSYGQDPVYMPAIYNFSAPAGQRWNRTGLSASQNERMYHSTAILLPDSSILISGSNPNADFTTGQWRSRTDVERWYPSYYNEARPTYTGAPTTLSYGGEPFDLVMDNFLDETAAKNTKVVIIRGGFNTHAIGFGQKMLQLESTYTVDQQTNKTTLHVSQLPGNPGPTLFQPGSAMIFVVTNGIPSEGEFLMVGSGQLGEQPTTTNAALPSSTVLAVETPSESTSEASSGSGSGTGTGSSASNSGNGAAGLSVTLSTLGLGVVGAAVGALLL
jgi:hypothetical protein